MSIARLNRLIRGVLRVSPERRSTVAVTSEKWVHEAATDVPAPRRGWTLDLVLDAKYLKFLLIDSTKDGAQPSLEVRFRRVVSYSVVDESFAYEREQCSVFDRPSFLFSVKGSPLVAKVYQAHFAVWEPAFSGPESLGALNHYVLFTDNERIDVVCFAPPELVSPPSSDTTELERRYCGDAAD